MSMRELERLLEQAVADALGVELPAPHHRTGRRRHRKARAR